MKKIILIVCILFGLALPAQAKSIRVLTTTTDLKFITEFIGGDKVHVDSLGKGTQNYHFLSAKPSYMIKAKKADLFIRVGFELEIGYETLILEGSRNPKIKVGRVGHLDASSGITPLDIPENIDRSMGDVHPSGNPHYWLDPFNVKIIAKNIAEKLSDLSPQNKFYYNQNLARFNQEIDRKMLEWMKKLEPFKAQEIAVYHRSWEYFVQRFDLDVVCELEPKPGVPPSPGHLKDVIEIINEKNVKVILMEVFYSEKAARFVSKQTDAKVVVVPNSVGGTKEAKDYFSLMDIIIYKLVEGLQR